MTTTPAEHTERTPLLGSTTQNGVQNHTEATGLAAHILPYIMQFQARGLPPDDSWCPQSVSIEGDRTAFILLIYLHHSRSLRRGTNSVDDVWEEWTREVKDSSTLLEVEQRIAELWDAFLRVPRTPSEIEHILWRSFPFQGGQSLLSSRVIDLYAYLPREILTHRALELSLLRIWKHNLLSTPQSGSAWNTVKRTLRAVLTPRTIHAIDVSGLVAYLGILVLYSLNPPDAAVEEAISMQSFRAALIVSYGTAKFLQDLSWTKSSFLLIVIAFLLRFPAPSSNDLGYSVILIGLCAHIIQLHMPSPPSPLYLFPFQQALPLATLIWNGFSKIYLPVLLLFSPAILVVSALLSLSLADLTVFSVTTAIASPLEARTMFLMLLAVLLLLLICSLGMLVLVYPFVSSYSSASPWDRYSTSLGLDARRYFVRTILTYTFPQGQFDPLIFTSSPTHSSSYLRILSLITLLQRTLWWMSVGPLSILLVAYLFSGIFL